VKKKYRIVYSGYSVEVVGTEILQPFAKII